MSSDVRSPSDVAAGDDGRALVLGGRLVASQGRWWLVDAFARIEVEPPSAHDFRDGSLAVLAGTLRGGRLIAGDTRLLQHPGSSARELARVGDGGLARRLRLRSEILTAVRDFFQRDGFLEVDTPIRVSECAPEAQIDPFESGDHCLVTSPELHMKRLLVGGVPRLFQLVHCFREDELGSLHAPEFMMLEWYRAFAPLEAVMADTERLISELCARFSGGPRLSLASGVALDVTLPFLRITVRDAFRRFAGVDDAARLALSDEDTYFQTLVDRVEPALAALDRPVFLCEYPASQAALARLAPRDPSVAERFELYLGGIELCNGYGELNDAAEQRRRFALDLERRRQRGHERPALPERFLDALEQGMPPAAGNALGMERLIMLLLGEPSIDRIRPFPEA
ncbi:MAG: EF-P lysine aminoacylase EpmA [Polyangiaceae bacterium]